MANRRKSQLWVTRIEAMCGDYPERVEFMGRVADLGDGFKEIKRLTLNAGGVEVEHSRYVLLRQVSDVVTATIEHTEKAILLQASATKASSGVDETEEAVAQGDAG